MSIIGDLEEGQIIGLQFSFGDFDDWENPNLYHEYWTVSGQDETFRYAERFADFILAPLDNASTKVAVEASTWGRIKANFR